MIRSMSGGGVLLLAMLVIGMFLAMMMASTAYINRQFRQTVRQEQEQIAFFAADAGIQYVIFLLSSGTYTAGELASQDTITKTVEHPGSGEDIGTFRIEVVSSDADAQRVDFNVVGQDISIPICQRLTATVASTASGFQVTDWDHQVTCTVF